MNCSEVQPLIDAYIDGELDLVTSAAVERHLKDCPNCDADLQEPAHPGIRHSDKPAILCATTTALRSASDIGAACQWPFNHLSVQIT